MTVNARENMQAVKGGETEESGKKYQVREDKNGNKYWEIENSKDIFKGLSTVTELKKAAFNYILNGYKGGEDITEIIDGKPLEFRRISAREFVYGKQSKELDKTTYKQKMRMSTSVLDLVNNAFINYNSPDNKSHKMFPNGFTNYQGRVGIDNNIFKYIVRVGKTADGNVFYDINLEADGKVPGALRHVSHEKMSASNGDNTTSVNKSQEILRKNQQRGLPEINADIEKNNEERLALQKEQTELRNQYNSLNNSEEVKDIIERMPENSAGEDAIQKWVNEYKAWEDRTQFAKIKERLDTVSENLSKLNKQFDALYDEREETQERQDIEKSGLSENEYFVKKAVSEYGYTPYFYDAGYILQNGNLLNFSGEKGKHYGSRGLDHRNIGSIFTNTSDSSAMLRFMSYGNVRIMDETPGIDILKSTEPTKEQYAKIRNHIEHSRSREYYSVDFTDERGNTIGSLEYEGRVSANKVIADIKEFFETGKVPEQDSEMDINRFLYQQRDADYMAAVNSGDMETAQRMVDERAKEKGYSTKVYHGTRGFGFTIPDVSKSDDGISFFATDSIPTATTYSGAFGTKDIGNRKYPTKSTMDYRKELEELGYGDMTAFVEGEDGKAYIEQYGKYMDDETRRELGKGTAGVLGAKREGTHYQSFKFIPLEKGFSLNDLEENRGNYGLYANTDNFLEVDANHSDWNNIHSQYGATTRSISKRAKELGYSGVIIRNVYDNGYFWDDSIDSDENYDLISNVYVFFDPESQVKSADPVTYDDDGNVIPLSERLNEGNEDIRYQLRSDGSIPSDIDLLIEASEEAKSKSGNFSKEEINALDIISNRLRKIKDLRQKRGEYREELKKAKTENPNSREVIDLKAYIRAYSSQIANQEDNVLKLMGENTPVGKSVLKKMRNRQVDLLEQRGRERLSDYREGRNESEKKTALRKAVLKKTNTLYDWLMKNSQKEHIPEVLKETVGGLLENIDFTATGDTKKDRRFAAKMNDLALLLEKQEKYRSDTEAYANDEIEMFIDMPDQFAQEVRGLTKTITDAALANSDWRVMDLNSEQLGELNDILRIITKSVREMNNLTANGRYATATEAANNTITDLDRLSEYQGNTGRVYKFINFEDRTPVYAFEKFGNAGSEMFLEIQRGWS
ncbi:MAG: hypothetical protein KBS59_04375, partial [Clostridiales bacterium]|nr:hypothetical protein [Clostridiales bacterium]